MNLSVIAESGSVIKKRLAFLLKTKQTACSEKDKVYTKITMEMEKKCQIWSWADWFVLYSSSRRFSQNVVCVYLHSRNNVFFQWRGVFLIRVNLLSMKDVFRKSFKMLIWRNRRQRHGKENLFLFRWDELRLQKETRFWMKPQSKKNLRGSVSGVPALPHQ